MRQRYRTDKQLLPVEGRALSLLAESKNGSPVIAGNQIELFTSSLKILQLFIDEINQAKKALHLEFYIWALGGDADRLARLLLQPLSEVWSVRSCWILWVVKIGLNQAGPVALGLLGLMSPRHCPFKLAVSNLTC